MPCLGLFGLVWLAWCGVILRCAIRRAQQPQRPDRFDTERDLALALHRELTRALDDVGA